VILFLGSDNNLDADWDAGVFKDNFNGAWSAIDGNPVYMELTEETEDYNLYTVPILLNGEECSLHVSYVYETEAYEILGAYKGLEGEGMASKEILRLRPGNEITTLHYVASFTGDDEAQLVEMDTFTVTESTVFADEDMGDGDFLFLFVMTDARGESAWSEEATFTVAEGELQF
jgi:hypothetical protein